MVVGTRTYYFRRCKQIRWSIIESIPDELLFEILLRLPAQDIYFGARLVCQKWYHMTHTKKFIQKHLERASYGLIYMDESGDVAFSSATEDGGINTFKLNHDYQKKHLVLRSWNGLLLETKSIIYEVIYDVTNVLTRQAFRLPPCPYPILELGLSGIGYDAASMTYKVVVSYVDFDAGKYGCGILTVGVDKSWRSICIDHLSSFGNSTIMSHPVITEGFVHCICNGGTVVFTLNLETEIIAETPAPIPKGVLLEKDTYCCLSTGRYLSLFLQRRKLVWEFFEMKPESGEWRKLANICLKGQKERIKRLGFKHDEVDIMPCGWLKYPEVLALRIQHAFIIFYNLITREIGAEKLSTNKSRYMVTLHKNSLIWLGGS